ncbi:M48 family metalloprotease [Cytophagaceae bacterium ABcell3]|nr:M48 family metalloprotease [Cytophagaceae bacterium ABcell3]
MKRFYLLLLLLSSTVMVTCKKKPNIFTIEDDINFGKQVRDFIENPDSSGMIVLKPEDYPFAYDYLFSIRDYILNSGKVRYKDRFEWHMRIIHDDNTLNAFAAPGGYIYIYTGLIKYLEHEDHFAGILGHEIAHSDRRHSTNRLSEVYGWNLLFDVVFGKDPSAVRNITQGLMNLGFSRANENDADAYSVKYLCQEPARYESDGAAGFFQKLIDEGQGGKGWAFLSTHPSGENRVKNITEKAVSLSCDTDLKSPQSWRDFRNSLP